MRKLKITKRTTNQSETNTRNMKENYPQNADGYLPLPSHIFPIRHTRIPAVEVLKMDFPDHDWNISGGWGYTRETAVIIEEDRYPTGLSMETMFVHYRTYEELIVFQEKDRRFSGIEWKMMRQALYGGPEERHYDFIEYLVTAFADSDWEMLKNDWDLHNGYFGDQEGLAAHEALRRSKQIGFLTACWFDISRFYGKTIDRNPSNSR